MIYFELNNAFETRIDGEVKVEVRVMVWVWVWCGKCKKCTSFGDIRK